MDAAVDVGTNTVRLLLGKAHGGTVAPERYFRRITRLGGDFSSDNGLAPEPMERTLSALREAADLVASAAATKIRAVGTAVLRRAPNGSEFVQRVIEETGIRLEIIDGEEEARLTSLGVRSALQPTPETCLIFDLGGGSTEFTLWQEKGPAWHRSFPLGVVRLAEEEPDPERQQVCVKSVLQQLQTDLRTARLWPVAKADRCRLVGTAGTVTTLAALHLQMGEYDWRRVNNLELTRPGLTAMLQRLEPLLPAERETLPGMETGRGDLIVPGLRTVLAILDLLGHDRLTVSDFGLLEGLLLDLNATPAEETA